MKALHLRAKKNYNVKLPYTGQYWLPQTTAGYDVLGVVWQINFDYCMQGVIQDFEVEGGNEKSN